MVTTMNSREPDIEGLQHDMQGFSYKRDSQRVLVVYRFELLSACSRGPSSPWITPVHAYLITLEECDRLFSIMVQRSSHVCGRQNPQTSLSASSDVH